MRILQPPHWPRPKGYANGIVAEGRLVFVAGQIGWDPEQRLVAPDLVEQTEQALKNVVAVLSEAGARAEHVVRMTWYVVDRHAYSMAQADIGRTYRSIMGAHYPAMTLVEVSALLEDGALVEIEATAMLPNDEPVLPST